MTIHKAAFVCVVLVCGISAAFAHSGATGIVKERMDSMKDTGKQMKTIGEMVKGKTPYEREKAATAARTISLNAAKIPELFPEGSTSHPSEALPAIWQEWGSFEELAGRMGQSADALFKAANTASSGSELGSAFRQLAGTCKSCHEKFRLEKK